MIAPPAQSEVPVKRERILNRFEALKTELRPTLRLAGPLVLAELGWMSMAVVDTVMVGRVSPEAIAGVSLGGLVFYTAATFGSGLLLGLDTLVSQAFGAGKLTDCHRSLVSSLYLCLCLAPALMGGIWLVAPCLRSFGIHPSVLHETMPNLRALMWSTLPLLLYFAFRRYLQGMGLVRPVTFALVTANLVNALGNWVLIYGHLGAPPLGAEGSGWSTCCSRIYMAAVLVGYTLYDNRGRRAGTSKTQNAVWPNRPDLARIGEKYSDQWHVAHLNNSRDVVPVSVMPAYSWLMTTELRIDDLPLHLKAQRVVGVPYTDDMIANAALDAYGQSNPDSPQAEGVTKRYGKATTVRAFDGQPDVLTEMDALVAYLQILGRLTDAAHKSVAAAGAGQ